MGKAKTADKPVKKESSGLGWWIFVAVVIVLAVAAGFGLQYGGAEILAAKKAKVTREMQAVQAAVTNYKKEYNSTPPALSSSNAGIIKALCGDNPHKIPFLQLQSDDLNADGEMIDPWGTPYRLLIDVEGGAQMVSAGPDKTFNTADDITYEWNAASAP